MNNNKVQADEYQAVLSQNFMIAKNNLERAKREYDEARNELLESAKPECNTYIDSEFSKVAIVSEYGQIDVIPKARITIAHPELLPRQLKPYVVAKTTYSLNETGRSVLYKYLADEVENSQGDDIVDIAKCNTIYPSQTDQVNSDATSKLCQIGVKIAMTYTATVVRTGLIEPDYES